MSNDPHKIVQLAMELEEELKRTRIATKDDLDAMEKRLTHLITGGSSSSLTALVEKGNALSAETGSLENSVEQNQPKKDKP